MNRHNRLLDAVRGHPRHALGVGAALVIAVGGVLAGVLLFRHPAPPQQISYTNISRNFKTCVLTTTPDQESATAWATIQAAAHNRPINAQHVTAPPGPPDELIPYLNSLIALHCQLIITSGPDAITALTTVAKANPHLTFANISRTSADLPNVHDLPEDKLDDIKQMITSACRC